VVVASMLLPATDEQYFPVLHIVYFSLLASTLRGSLAKFDVLCNRILCVKMLPLPLSHSRYSFLSSIA